MLQHTPLLSPFKNADGCKIIDLTVDISWWINEVVGW